MNLNNIQFGLASHNWTQIGEVTYENVHKTMVIEGDPVRVDAHKNSVDQTITAGSDQKLTLGTAWTDGRGGYDTTNSRWTPAAGTIRMNAAFRVVAGDVAGDFSEVVIFKNSAEWKRSPPIARAGAGKLGASIEVTDRANGTDYYEIYVFAGGGGAGNRTISGLPNHTYFIGTALQ